MIYFFCLFFFFYCYSFFDLARLGFFFFLAYIIMVEPRIGRKRGIVLFDRNGGRDGMACGYRLGDGDLGGLVRLRVKDNIDV